MPALSTIELAAAGVAPPVSTGARAEMRYWWLRNEPPKAPWKNRSATT